MRKESGVSVYYCYVSYGTVEPPNKGHFGTGNFVLCKEVVLFSEVEIVLAL